MSLSSLRVRRFVRAAIFALVGCGAACLAPACLDRKVIPSEPSSSEIFVDQVAQTLVTKIDLLFMVDNSASMADKQDILKTAVPVLVQRLVTPNCVDEAGAALGVSADADGHCASGQPEFRPVRDIHIGIVSSSLGSHGAANSSCNVAPPALGKDTDDPRNDNAHLIGTVRGEVIDAGAETDPGAAFPLANTWNNSGFLAWDPGQKAAPPGATDATAFARDFAQMVRATGQLGCGYEAQLESWYRFLIDPEPPANVAEDPVSQHTVRGSALVVNADGTTTCNGCDQALLAQRKAFLRPDSLVAIVMLTDENDCSIRDDDIGWFVASRTDPMPRATAACATNPNDVCCRSCRPQEAAPPSGCMPLSEDPVCSTAPEGEPYAVWDSLHDNANLRCFAQKQRFGFDLLYPTSRYVSGLTSPTLTLQSDGKTQVQNPLFDGGAGPPRDPTNIFLAGIVGVPWQDIADDASQRGPGLTYLSAKDLLTQNRWPMLLGDPSASPPAPPSDPFMIESDAPRSGKNPVTGDPIVPATSTDPTASPINGHEQNPVDLADLEFACTFPLAPRACTLSNQACDCAPTPKDAPTGDLLTERNSPLCQPPGGGAATTTQSYAKAYPGTRELQVLKDFGENAIVASICPKVTAPAAPNNPSADPNYGYNPAVNALIARLKLNLTSKCLPRKLNPDPTTHQVLCEVIEAEKSGCDCSLPGRAPANPSIIPAVQAQLRAAGVCGNAGEPACTSFCECAIQQEQGDSLTACQAGEAIPSGTPPGFCYVDESSPGAASLLAHCAPNEKQQLRFVDADAAHPTPASGATAFIACLGAPVQSVGDGG